MRVWGLVGVVMVMSGCKLLSPRDQIAEVDPVDDALLSTASAVANDARLYGPARNREVVVPVAQEVAPVEGALAEQIDLHFAGDVLPVVRALSAFLGWELQVEGVPRPVLVRVEAVGQPVGIVLRHVGEQAGTEAMVVVDAGARSVRVVFANWRVSR